VKLGLDRRRRRVEVNAGGEAGDSEEERGRGVIDAPGRDDKLGIRFFSRWMFLPRSLTGTPSASNNQPRTLHRHSPQPARERAAAEGPTEDPAILCALAFSDYELWSNPSLRDPNRDGCKFLLHIVCKSQLTQKNKLVVPLRTVLHTSSLFLAANSVSLTEAAIVKSLRAHARDAFDIRMIVVDKTRSRRGHHGYAPAGGYEVRRKGWAEVTQRFPTFTTEYWDAQTIYIVRFPLPLTGRCALTSSYISS
jgi:hypothetical protein